MAYVKVERCLLSELLKERNMTQNELAEALGVSRQQINRYVKENRVMSLRAAVTIARKLDVPVERLYKWGSFPFGK